MCGDESVNELVNRQRRDTFVRARVAATTRFNKPPLQNVSRNFINVFLREECLVIQPNQLQRYTFFYYVVRKDEISPWASDDPRRETVVGLPLSISNPNDYIEILSQGYLLVH